jgi:hypothetical protein
MYPNASLRAVLRRRSSRSTLQGIDGRWPFRGSAAGGSSSTRRPPVASLSSSAGAVSARRCATRPEHADIWHGFGDAATVARKSRILDGHCADVGRDPAEIVRSTGVQQPVGARIYAHSP